MKPEHTRRLAAVWFADIVGYTELSGRDEDEALAVVAALQAIANREVVAFGGRVVKFVGDAALATFESTDSAVRAALAVREAFSASPAALRQRATLRIGIHIGEIAEAADGDVYGDGVNAASRIQSAAEPGQILLSDTAYEQIAHRGDFSVVAAGTRQLKGLRRPLGLFALSASGPRALVSEMAAPGEAGHVQAMGEGEAGLPDAGASPATPRTTRRVSRGRAVAVGMLGGIATLFGYVLFAGNASEEADAVSEEPLPAADLQVRLNLGVEAYYAGLPEAAAEHLSPFLRGTGATELGRRGLRYLARSFVESGRPDSAQVALHALMDGEPPIALLIPALESDSLVELYYAVRRERISRTGVEAGSTEISGVLIFDFQVLISDPVAAAAAREGHFGSAVARMLETDLLGEGVEVLSLEAMSFEGRGDDAYVDLDEALRGSGAERPSHAVIGSLAVREERALLSAWVFEIETGRLVSTQQVTGALAELLDLPSMLARGIVGEMASLPAG